MDNLNEYRKLHQDIYQCDLCKQHGYEVHRVQPEWDENKKPTSIEKWAVIVGQAPGITEYETGKFNIERKKESDAIPFSGKAGDQLRKWFEEEDIDYRPIFKNSLKTALTKCYPGKYKSGDRKPTRKEIKFCEQFLVRQIELTHPKFIILFGKQAINWFFPKEEWINTIGEIRRWKDCEVICLPHPSPLNTIINTEYVKQMISESIKLINQKFNEHGME